MNILETPKGVTRSGSSENEKHMSDLKRFVDLYQEAAQDAQVTPSTTFEVDDAPRRHAKYQRRIVRLTLCSGICGLLLGLALSLVQCVQGAPRCLEGLLRVPPLCGVIAVFFTLAVACLVVPGDFLEGPFGQSWMRIIGTKTVLGARIACLLFVLVITLPLVALLVLVLLHQG